ncbi:hypothetical protein BB559_000459 [Furculomyces boomerangus]|uniref:39S ribosomal protein L50, mitochondrial n=2 Tax=Harpellales TaxID=61421 RepID=A0A2T9Z574_9FUNG|nr:hypothetical protein BB559_000459 [Furculomyces boomerangus]PWA02646.1 hypothetical protein BB558_001199 [Smittium angustum]
MIRKANISRISKQIRFISVQPTNLQASGGFFGKLFGGRKKESEDKTIEDIKSTELSEAQETNELDQLNMTFESEDVLKEKRIKYSKRKYFDVEFVEKELEPIVQKVFPESGSNWKASEIVDTKAKQEIAIESIKLFGKQIDNLSLNNMQTVQDLINFYTTKPDLLSAKHPVAKYFISKNEEDLPKNMKFVPFKKHERKLHAYY